MHRSLLRGIGLGVIVIALFIAFFTPLITTYKPEEFSGFPLEKPGNEHILGTNDMGQDIFTRLLYGTRATLIIGFVGAMISVLIGSSIGLISGYYGGNLDELICRCLDVLMTIPAFPLLLVLTVLLEPGIYVISMLMGLLGGAYSVRVIRSQVLSIVETNYIQDSRALGLRDSYIMVRHILPNLLPLIMVKFVFAAQGFMLIGVGLGFLGIGDPAVIDWGQMINRAYSSGAFALGLWWWIIPPGIAITVISISLVLIGYSFEDRINPRLKHMRI